MFKKLEKKKYFQSKIKATVCIIWDLEFKIFKLGIVREGTRQDRDDKFGKWTQLEEQVKKESEQGGLKETNIDEFKRLEDQQVLLKRDIERYEGQIKSIDLEINGSDPTAEYPDGVIGLNYEIDKFVELKGVFKNWIKQL